MLDVKNRYQNLYIPSDFYHIILDWTRAFSLSRPLQLGTPTKFNICSREVDPLSPFPDEVDPEDADYSYCAKVKQLTIQSCMKHALLIFSSCQGEKLKMGCMTC